MTSLVTSGNELWVTDNGDYGITPLIIVDYTEWTAADFDKLDAAPASEKQATAIEIWQQYNPPK